MLSVRSDAFFFFSVQSNGVFVHTMFFCGIYFVKIYFVYIDFVLEASNTLYKVNGYIKVEHNTHANVCIRDGITITDHTYAYAHLCVEYILSI